MAFRIVWTETALADPRDLVRYIARDDRQVEKRFGDWIVTKGQTLQPSRGLAESFRNTGRIACGN